jgi:hypothetical protein
MSGNRGILSLGSGIKGDAHAQLRMDCFEIATSRKYKICLNILRERDIQRVTKRCLLSLLTNSVLVYEPRLRVLLSQ